MGENVEHTGHLRHELGIQRDRRTFLPPSTSPAPAVRPATTPPTGEWAFRRPRHTSLVDADAVPTTGGAWWSRAVRAKVARTHPRGTTFGALAGLATLSAALRAVAVHWVHGPFIFMDELGYERMAQSFAHTGHFSLFGKGGLAYSPLYPIALSPIYALTASMQTAYAWVKVENSLLFSLSVFPVYGIARFALPRGRSLGVAALSLIAPLLLYSGYEMSESLAYPLCLVAVWTMLRAVRRPSMANDAVLVGAIVLASAARLQLVVLVPAALTAILLLAFLHGRLQATRQALLAHRVLFGACGVSLIGFFARWATNGHHLPLAGRYSNVGASHASVARVFELFFQHLAELDWAVGVIPFAASLLAGYALVRVRFPQRDSLFASVAVATTFWMLLEAAYDAAAFDGTRNLAHPPPFYDLPRIHERYLIYLVPFFLIALFAVLPLRRSTPELVGAAVVAALLPALIPFGTVINGTSVFDAFALLLFGTTKAGHTVPVTHATTLIVVLAGLMASVFVLAGSRRLHAPAAVFATAFVLLGFSALEYGNQVTGLTAKQFGLPTHADWVDRVVGRNADVALVSGRGRRTLPLRETAFWNASIRHVYYTCAIDFGTGFGDRPLNGSLHVRYAVVPVSLSVEGRVLARDRPGKLVLVAPAAGALKVSRPRSTASDCSG